MRWVIVKDPAVGFMQAQYCVLITSFITIFTCSAPTIDLSCVLPILEYDFHLLTATTEQKCVLICSFNGFEPAHRHRMKDAAS